VNGYVKDFLSAEGGELRVIIDTVVVQLQQIPFLWDGLVPSLLEKEEGS
jgi:hypothetical protein